MGIGIGVATLIGSSLAGIAATFAIASATVGLASYRSLSLLSLPTLNWQRTRLLIDTFVRTGKAASPAKVNAAERYPPQAQYPDTGLMSVAWPWGVASRGGGLDGRAPDSGTEEEVGAGPLPSRMAIRYGAQLHRTAETGEELSELLRIFASEKYLLSFRYGSIGASPARALAPATAALPAPSLPSPSPNAWPAGVRGGSIAISMAEGHDAQDALRAMLQAARLERLLVTGSVDPACPSAALESTLRYAQAELPILRSKCEDLGWDLAFVLFVPHAVVDWRLSLSRKALLGPQAPGPGSAPDATFSSPGPGSGLQAAGGAAWSIATVTTETCTGAGPGLPMAAAAAAAGA